MHFILSLQSFYRKTPSLRLRLRIPERIQECTLVHVWCAADAALMRIWCVLIIESERVHGRQV